MRQRPLVSTIRVHFLLDSICCWRCSLNQEQKILKSRGRRWWPQLLLCSSSDGYCLPQQPFHYTELHVYYCIALASILAFEKLVQFVTMVSSNLSTLKTEALKYLLVPREFWYSFVNDLKRKINFLWLLLKRIHKFSLALRLNYFSLCVGGSSSVCMWSSGGSSSEAGGGCFLLRSFGRPIWKGLLSFSTTKSFWPMEEGLLGWQQQHWGCSSSSNLYPPASLWGTNF